MVEAPAEKDDDAESQTTETTRSNWNQWRNISSYIAGFGESQYSPGYSTTLLEALKKAEIDDSKSVVENTQT